jgi:dTDP-4-dehydrorhamnose 3,5-epimerase
VTKPFVETTPLYVDDRGSVWCPFDNNGDGDVGLIKRTYVVHNWEKGRIRAWHGHNKGWTGMHVIHGAAKLVAIKIGGLEWNDRPGLASPADSRVKTVVLSDRNPGIFWIPPGYYNGSVSLEDNTKILVYSTLTFDEVKEDDVRHELLHNHYMEYFKVKDR